MVALWRCLFLLPSVLQMVQAIECINRDEDVPEYTLSSTSYRRQANESKQIDVYFHVASSEERREMISDETVDKQFDVLHSVYLTYGFDLKLVNISRIVNDTVAKGFYNDQSGIDDFDAYLDFRRNTRRGDYAALNVYFFTNLNPSLGGQCNLPVPTDVGTQGFWTDGCFINADRMPGQWAEALDDDEPQRGHTAIHEVGHWLGLLHTFQGRLCDGVNDQVTDTPAQAGGSRGCPVGRDSCPDSPGLDPIHNYMDYSSDNCTNEFTPGQEARMHQFFDLYRKNEF